MADLDDDIINGSAAGDGSDSSDDEGGFEGAITLEEHQTRKQVHYKEMAKIEAEYAKLRQVLFTQQIERIDDALKRLEDGTLAEFRQSVRQIEYEARQQHSVAAKRKWFEEQDAKLMYEGAKYGIECTYKEKKSLCHGALLEELQYRKYLLKQAKTQTDQPLPAAFNVIRKRKPKPKPPSKPFVPFDPVVQMPQQPQRSRLQERVIEQPMRDMSPPISAPSRKRRRHQTVVSSPYIVYMLSDADLAEDMRIFARTSSKKPAYRR